MKGTPVYKKRLIRQFKLTKMGKGLGVPTSVIENHKNSKEMSILKVGKLDMGGRGL